MPPDADQSLFFYPRSKVSAESHQSNELRESPSSIFVAQQTTRMNVHFGLDHLVIQVCFRPGYLYQLLNKFPIQDFQGKELDAELFDSRGIVKLNEQLQETNNYLLMIEFIERYLLKQLAYVNVEILPIDRAIDFLKHSTAPVSLDWLADQACLSTRQFERNFISRMGMTPKFYARISRFDRAFKTKLKNPEMGWLQVAYNCGYFDYSHLMRDFRQFAEVSPSMLIAEDSITGQGRA